MTATTSDPAAITPVERHGGVLVKRDDQFAINGATGGKARATLLLADGASGLVGVGARFSPQIARVALVAQARELPARVHTAAGKVTPEMRAAAAAGAEVVQHRPGYLSVIRARARADAAERGWRLVPFGAASQASAGLAERQARALPLEGVRRLVVPVGSGTTLAGILRALGGSLPILGVLVGGFPGALDRFGPLGWEGQVELVSSPLPFDRAASDCRLGDLELAGHYEAKCLPFLEAGDLLWIVGANV